MKVTLKNFNLNICPSTIIETDIKKLYRSKCGNIMLEFDNGKIKECDRKEWVIYEVNSESKLVVVD